MSLASIFGGNAGLSNNSKITPIVFVVDHDSRVRASLEVFIRSQGWRPQTFASAQEFLVRPRADVPSCLILDVSLRGLNGLELQKKIALERCEMPIIFVTRNRNIPTIVQAMKAGAVEFLIKPCNQDALLGAIRESLERSRVALGREFELHELHGRYRLLTRRERQVLALVVSGLLNKQAGLKLGISEITVKAHRRQVMRKMKANSLPDLVRMAETLHLERPVNSMASLPVAV